MGLLNLFFQLNLVWRYIDCGDMVQIQHKDLFSFRMRSSDIIAKRYQHHMPLFGLGNLHSNKKGTMSISQGLWELRINRKVVFHCNPRPWSFYSIDVTHPDPADFLRQGDFTVYCKRSVNHRLPLFKMRIRTHLVDHEKVLRNLYHKVPFLGEELHPRWQPLHAG